MKAFNDDSGDWDGINLAGVFACVVALLLMGGVASLILIAILRVLWALGVL